MKRAEHSEQAQYAFDKDPEFEEEQIGRFPRLFGMELLVWELYLSIRSSTPSELGVSFLEFLETYEKLNGESDRDRLFQWVAQLDGVHAEYTKRRIDKAREDSKTKAGKNREPTPIGRGG